MDVEKLKTLEDHAWKLSAYLADLMELETVADLNIPEEFGTREAYREHLANMVGAHMTLLRPAYNAIAEWQNV